MTHNDSFHKVINVHSYHPKLGSFAAYHLKKPIVRDPASDQGQ
jgi:hypothetical protein